MLSVFKWFPLALGTGLLGFSFSSPNSDVAKKPVDYAYVDQVFRKYDCVDCHRDARNPAAKLNLTTYEALMKGGRSGSALKAGDSAHSLLVEVVSGQEEPKMPPGGSALKADEIATLKEWIAEGAKTSPYSRAVSRYYSAKAANNWEDALKACKEIEAMNIAGVQTSEIAVKSRLPIYVALKDEKGWYESASKEVDFKLVNGNDLNDIAWTIVDPQTWLKGRDLDLALKAGNLAVANTRRQSGAVLDTLAWVYFRKGDKTKAIEIEKEALTCRDAQGATLDSLNESMKAFGG